MLLSATSLSLRLGPRPPSSRLVLAHARCEYSESVETARTSAPSFSKSARRSLKARISVGQTKVTRHVAESGGKGLKCVRREGDGGRSGEREREGEERSARSFHDCTDDPKEAGSQSIG